MLMGLLVVIYPVAAEPLPRGVIDEVTGLTTFKNCQLITTDWSDGDSFLVRFPDGSSHTIRLYGVDCFETSHLSSLFRSRICSKTSHLTQKTPTLLKNLPPYAKTSHFTQKPPTYLPPTSHLPPTYLPQLPAWRLRAPGWAVGVRRARGLGG